MAQGVRVRYAPSPTGDPHVGNIRTALFNWLYARHTGGTFVLRIEDTDQARLAPGALDAIFASLEWLGLDWDEGPRVGGPYAPYVQSERLPHYQEAAQVLLQKSLAYPCYCTPEELSEMRKAQQQRGEPPRYDRRCRNPLEARREAREAAGHSHVVRFMTPVEGEPVTVHDLIRGEVNFELSTLDDFVIIKSDGFPTYHLANVVDDNEMRISHVLRAEEWLPSTPRHLLLYDALGYQSPAFGHLPIILGPDRAKLAKRHGATSLREYQELGFFPEAMFNFLTLLGWSLDDRTEIIPKEELVRHFSLERIVKSAAIFNIEKLAWMNGVYLRQLSQKDLAERVRSVLERVRSAKGGAETFTEPVDPDYLQAIVPLIQERLKTLKAEEVWDLCSFFFLERPVYQSPPVPKGMDARAATKALEATIQALQPLERFDSGSLESTMRPLAERLGLKTGELFGAVRLAVTGSTAAPPLFDTLAVLGKERVLYRLGYTVDLIAAGT